jgi:hypothetical protein
MPKDFLENSHSKNAVITICSDASEVIYAYSQVDLRLCVREY